MAGQKCNYGTGSSQPPSVPKAVRLVSYLLPARYYVSLLQTIFLTGNIWSIIIPDCAAMLVMFMILFGLTLGKTKKRLL